MEYILSGEEMKACDSRTIAFFGVPSAVLMERAALACADVLCGEESAFDLTSVLAVCGSGNNGGDGFCMSGASLLPCFLSEMRRKERRRRSCSRKSAKIMV